MTGALRFFTSCTVALAYAPRLLRRLPASAAPSFSAVATLSSATSLSLRPASRRAADAAAVPLKKTRGRKKKSADTASGDSATAAASSSPPSASPAVANAAPRRSKAEMQLEENDVRVAIRSLMLSHMSSRRFSHRQDNAQLEKEREDYRRHHEAREQRLLAKDVNSQRLLGEDGRSIGNGIVPLVSSATISPYEDATDVRKAGRGESSGASAVWRTLNPVGLAASQAAAAAAAAEDATEALSEVDYAAFLASPAAASAATGEPSPLSDANDWRTATLATLCAPNLSFYDTDHDFRVSSAEVVRQVKHGETGAPEAVRSPCTPMSAMAAFGDGEENEGELSSDLPASVAAQLKRRFAEEAEDPDFAVSVYTTGGDDDEGPLQL